MDWREQVNAWEQKPQRKLPTFSDTSSQGSCKQFTRDHHEFEPAMAKFICNFGGRFLPRPSDGELRYVGGDRHLVRISRDISWQGLICKTTKLIRRAHVIKYHLPGEQVSMLISITSDDDLRHMIDECVALEKCQERLTMYLFSDSDDERQLHLVVGRSSDSDSEREAQFIALVNGLFRPSDESGRKSLGNSSATGIDQLMLDYISGEGFVAARTEEDSHSVTSRGQLETKMPLSSQSRMTNKDYNAQSNDGNMVSEKRTSKAHLGPSVPSSESTHVAKRGQGSSKSVSRHQPGLQQVATNKIGKSHETTTAAAQEKGSPRKQMLVAVDNNISSMNTPSPDSNNSSLASQRSPYMYGITVPLSRGSQKTGNQQTRSDDSMMKPTRHSIQEESMSHPAAEQLRKNAKNFRLHDKQEFSEPSHEYGTSTDDMYINASLHTLEKSVAANSMQKQCLAVPATSSNTPKKDHPSKPIGSGGEAVLPCSFTYSDRTAEVQPNVLVRPSSERQQERVSSPRPDDHSSRKARPHSAGAGSGSPQIRTPSQEAEDNDAPSISDAEMCEAKNNKLALPANAMLGTDLISDVQIITNGDLEDLREMGSGAFGTVFHGKWKGTDVAIKRIKNSCFMYPSSQADKLITEFWREAAIISKLHHPNILAFYGIVKNGPGGTLATVTEFMVNGSLKKVLLRKDKYLDWRRQLMLAMDAAIGMEYLHSKDIVHFDLKCDNLLVNMKDPSRPICKVADFGLSKMKQASLVSGGMRGTLPWMAPELLTMSGTKVSEKVDVYSFAIVMWEILTGEDPYDGMHYGGVIGGILSNTLRPPVPTSCNPEWRRLMEQCWSTDPEKRPSFTEVVIRLRTMLEATKSESLI